MCEFGFVYTTFMHTFVIFFFTDPWQLHKDTHHLSEPMKDKYFMDMVACIEALGNAAMHRSFEHIQSYFNTSSTPSVLKRAGLHSLRHYHEDLVSIGDTR